MLNTLSGSNPEYNMSTISTVWSLEEEERRKKKKV
jgi:hypothetical protein